jgi:hypothetical protein
VLEAEEVAEVPAARPDVERLPDRLEAEAAGLELVDQRQAVEVLLAVVARAALELGGRQQAPGLVRADVPGRGPGAGGELVDP